MSDISNQIFTLTLTGNDVAYVMQAVGGLPTQTGAYPIFQKLEAQIKEQLPPPEENENE